CLQSATGAELLQPGINVDVMAGILSESAKALGRVEILVSLAPEVKVSERDGIRCRTVVPGVQRFQSAGDARILTRRPERKTTHVRAVEQRNYDVGGEDIGIQGERLHIVECEFCAAGQNLKHSFSPRIQGFLSGVGVV